MGCYLPDTFAASYRSLATSEAGRVTALAKDRKSQKYPHLTPSYLFTPVAMVSAEAIDPQSWALLKELGRRLRQETGEVKSASYLLERLSVAAQRGECGSNSGVLKATTYLTSSLKIHIFYF